MGTTIAVVERIDESHICVIDTDSKREFNKKEFFDRLHLSPGLSKQQRDYVMNEIWKVRKAFAVDNRYCGT